MKWFETARPEDFQRDREAARAAADRHYFPVDECRRGHLVPRLVSSNECAACKWQRYQISLGPNTELTLKREAERRQRYRDTPAGLALANKNALEYAKMRTQRIPPWHINERRNIRQVYDEKPTGDQVHHTVPLRPNAGKIVGLHCVDNMEFMEIAVHRKIGNSLPPGDAVEYVRRGMAVWKSDIGPGGRVNWKPYVGDRLLPFLQAFRDKQPMHGAKATEIFSWRIIQADSWQGLARWLNRIRDLPSGGLVLRRRRGLWVVRAS